MGVIKVFFCSKMTPTSRKKQRKIRKFATNYIAYIAYIAYYILKFKMSPQAFEHICALIFISWSANQPWLQFAHHSSDIRLKGTASKWNDPKDLVPSDLHVDRSDL